MSRVAFALASALLAACFNDPGPDQAATSDATTITTGPGTTTDTTGEPTSEPENPCGDGVVDPDETCDDGEDNAPDGECTPECKVAACGDGFEATAEGCDDGNLESGDGCSEACDLESCGDTIVQPGEECDDGNAIDTDECTGLCRFPACGDGFLHEGEVCDDGNDEQNDGCLNTCTPAVCGDGFVNKGVEGCDDGNIVLGDGCSDLCVLEFLRVFVTAGSFTGSLRLEGGDDLCQEEAVSNGLPGTYAAWLSVTPENPPKEQFSTAAVPYVLTNGTTIADSFDAFIVGALLAPIGLTAGQQMVPNGTLGCEGELVWTATLANGDGANDNCSSFLNDHTNKTSVAGSFTAIDGTWTEACKITCDRLAHLYCFQQAGV